MKKITTYLLQTKFWVLGSFVLGLIIVACSSDNESSSIESLGKTSITLEVEGIQDTRMAPVSKKGLQAEKKSSAEEALSTAKFQNFQGFDARATMAGVPARVKKGIQQAGRSTGAAKASKGLLAATMENGVKYFLVLKRDSDGTEVYRGTHTAGEHSAIEIEAGIDYSWYAFSINKTSLPAVANNGEVAAADLANQDVLIASGTINPNQDQSNQLPITFHRNTVRYNVAINARGLFGKVQESSEITLKAGTEAVLKTGDLDIFTGNYSNIQPASGTFNGATDDGTYGAAVKTGAFYSVEPATISANAFAVELEQLDIKLVDDRKLDQGESLERSFASATIATSNDTFTSKIGYEYDVNIQLVESGVKVKGVVWARTNLTYRSGDPDRYIFRRTNQVKNEKNSDYWNWKSETPTGTPGEVDACTQVYPEGTWRMPTGTEGSALDRVLLDNKKERYGILWGAYYAAGYDLDSGETPNTNYPELSRELYFTMFGHRTSPGLFGTTSIQDSPFGLLAGILGGAGNGEYWTDDSYSSSKANYLYWRYTRAISGLATWSEYAEIKNASKKQGRNMRCVRAI